MPCSTMFVGVQNISSMYSTPMLV